MIFLIFCVLSAILDPVYTAMSYNNGEFTVLLSSLDNHPAENRDFMDWHFYLRRINKKEKVVDGHFIAKKEIVQPRLEIETFYLTNNKFIRVDVNQQMKQLCEEHTGKAFVERFFEGNSTWSEDCIISPGYMQVKSKEKLDINKITHESYTKVFYGTFKFVFNFYNKEDVLVAKLSYVAVTKKRE